MKLKPEEFKAKTAEILQNLGDQGKVSTLLTELSEHNDAATVELTTAATTATKLTADNEKLRAANMELFLKIPSTNNPNSNTEHKDEDKKPDFKDLFNEDGTLK
jgi:hypothetical protein